jgi:hypothetical protein
MDEASRRLLACLKKEDPAAKLDTLQAFNGNHWEEILAAAERHGVVPILFHTLKPLFAGLDIPEPVREKMQRYYYLTAARNTRVYHELSAVLAAMDTRGISVILLKGAHLADTVYGNVALRPMVDVDLLARQEDLYAIHQVLTELGYRSPDGKVSYQLHLAPYWKKNGLRIDVHFDITWPPVSLRYDVGSLWDQAQRYTFGDSSGTDVLVLSPEDLVLHICWHTCISHGFANGLMALIDVVFIAAYYNTDPENNDLDWKRLWDRACQWGMERAVFMMLALTERLLGIPMPEPIQHKMALDQEVLRALQEAETMIFEPVTETGQPVSPIVARMFGRQGWREKLSYFRRRAFPPKEKMSVASRKSDGVSKLKIYPMYLLRVITLIKIHGQTIWSGLRRDPEVLRVLEKENRKNNLRDWLTGRD